MDSVSSILDQYDPENTKGNFRENVSTVQHLFLYNLIKSRLTLQNPYKVLTELSLDHCFL